MEQLKGSDVWLNEDFPATMEANRWKQIAND